MSETSGRRDGDRTRRQPRTALVGGPARVGVAGRLAACAAVVVLLLSATPAAAVPDLADVVVIAHRGNSGIVPENTLRAFRSAAARGALHWEADFRCTSSGTLVAAHDSRWDRQSTGTGLVRDRPWSYVKGRRARERWPDLRPRSARKRSERHPHLANVLRLAEERGATLHVDFKTRDCEKKMLRVLQTAHDRGVSIVFGAHTDEQRQLALETTTLPLASSDINAPTSVDTAAEAQRAVEEAAESPRVVWLSVRWSAVTRELVDEAHARGMRVRVWTFRRENTFMPAEYRSCQETTLECRRQPGDMRRWIADLHAETGFDAIYTDNTDTRNHGIPLPQ